jgi:NUDIX domain
LSEQFPVHSANVQIAGLRPTVLMLLFDLDGNIFIGKKIKNGRWDLPQGGIKPGEEIRDAFIRETEEETGLTEEKVILIGSFEDSLCFLFGKGKISTAFKSPWISTKEAAFVTTSRKKPWRGKSLSIVVGLVPDEKYVDLSGKKDTEGPTFSKHKFTPFKKIFNEDIPDDRLATYHEIYERIRPLAEAIKKIDWQITRLFDEDDVNNLIIDIAVKMQNKTVENRHPIRFHQYRHRPYHMPSDEQLLPQPAL